MKGWRKTSRFDPPRGWSSIRVHPVHLRIVTRRSLRALREIVAVLSAGFRSALASLAARLRSAVWFLGGMEDLRRELEDLVNAQPFVPFVVTSNDDFAIDVSSSKRALVGLRMLVVTDESGRLCHFPFTGIAHISEAKAA